MVSSELGKIFRENFAVFAKNSVFSRSVRKKGYEIRRKCFPEMMQIFAKFFFRWKTCV